MTKNIYNTYFKINNVILKIVCSSEALLEIKRVDNLSEENSNDICDKVKKQLEEYFNKSRKEFDIKFFLKGTLFQEVVWNELLNIKYGETKTYGEIAKQINKPGSARAVGKAIGANKILLLIPCHRVIGASGNLTGFSAGLDLKEQLLSLEQIQYKK